MSSSEIKNLVENEIIDVPSPIAIDGVPAVASRMGLHKFCVQCPTRICLIAERDGTCPYKLDYLVRKIDGVTVTGYGIATSGSSESRLHRTISKTMKGRNVTPLQFNKFASGIENILQLLKESRNEGGAEVLEYLHDVKKRVGGVYQCAEKLIAVDTGLEYSKETFDEASKEVKDTFSAAKALKNSIRQLEIFYNPGAASFGQPRRHPIYRIAERIVYIANASCDGNVTVKVEGRSWGEALLYDSFDLLPTALIENAVKYSLSSSVTVAVTENERMIHLSVDNVGPMIETVEVERLFERGFRGKWAKEHWRGDGLGLYAAQVVARAHGSIIRMSSEPTGNMIDGVPVARNIFMFSLTRSQSV